MSRPLRIVFEGAVYDVASPDAPREPTFVDDEEQWRLPAVIGQASARIDTLMPWPVAW